MTYVWTFFRWLFNSVWNRFSFKMIWQRVECTFARSQKALLQLPEGNDSYARSRLYRLPNGIKEGVFLSILFTVELSWVGMGRRKLMDSISNGELKCLLLIYLIRTIYFFWIKHNVFKTLKLKIFWWSCLNLSATIR